jgi:sugar lactone lactonase YvrE
VFWIAAAEPPPPPSGNAAAKLPPPAQIPPPPRTSSQAAKGPATPAPPPDPLVSIAHSDKLVWSGVVLAPDKRIFVVLPRTAGNAGPSLAVIGADGSPAAYPGGAWNAWSPTDLKADPAQAFVGLSAIHLAPDGSLWVVDSGVPSPGKAPLPGAAKLLRIDLAANRVTRSLVLPAEVLRPKSLTGEIRFHQNLAYITDTGAPALIVLDLGSGAARRLLDGDSSVTGQRPVIVDGETLKGSDNKPVMMDISRLEVTPDGKYLYYQPLPGPMFRIPTSLLDDPKASPQAVAAGVEFWYDTPALGGSAVAPDGTLFLYDVENDSVLSLTPDRVLTTVIRDPRLHWVGEPFLKDGTLTLPVEQLDRTAPFHHGKSLVRFPLDLFTLRIASVHPESKPK